MRQWLVVHLVALAVLTDVATGCGTDDLTFPGSYPTPTTLPTATCGAAGSVCSIGTDCCSGVCTTADQVNFTCE